MLNGINGTGGQHGAKGESHVRRMPHLVHGGGYHGWKPLAAMLRRTTQANPARLGILQIGIAKTFGSGDLAVFQHGPLTITRPVQG